MSKKSLTETEIKALEKRLHFAPFQERLNKLELKKDFK